MRLDPLRATVRSFFVPWLLVASGVSSPARATPAEDYVCGPLLSGSANLLVTLLDPWSGLPYDHLRCDCRWQSALGVCQSSAVLPQLPDADITTFEEVSPPEDVVDWQFLDAMASGDDLTLLYALELRLQLSPEDAFGGLIWGARADVHRYDRLWIRYRTATPSSTFELKLNSGLPGDIREKTVELAGSPANGSWVETTYDVAAAFPDTDAAHLNYLVLATSLAVAGEPEPVLWVDHLAFLADPAAAADCAVVTDCGGDPDCYPDLAVYEPQTGAVNVANALSNLTLLSEAGEIDAGEAAAGVARILASLAATPRVDGWMQDWHSPASLMPHPFNRIGSLTDLPQLYAALMVVEESWPAVPALQAAAAAVRQGMLDLTDLFEPAPDGDCPGKLHWAIDLCQGLQSGTLDYYGNDTLLGEFLAVATGAAPVELWSECLSRSGCELRGVGADRWYTTGAFACADSEIPAAETGGPFLQLAALTYLHAGQLPIGTPSLAESAANMLRAQMEHAGGLGLPIWGWSNHADGDSCDYVVCEQFATEQATPYVCGMGLSPEPVGAGCTDNLYAFQQLGAGAPLDTGTVLHDFGLRDVWNHVTGSAREDAYLYLDTGWLALGVLNACEAGLVRNRFAVHPVAVQGYDLLASLELPCPLIFGDGFESGDLSAWASSSG